MQTVPTVCDRNRAGELKIRTFFLALGGHIEDI